MDHWEVRFFHAPGRVVDLPPGWEPFGCTETGVWCRRRHSTASVREARPLPAGVLSAEETAQRNRQMTAHEIAARGLAIIRNKP